MRKLALLLAFGLIAPAALPGSSEAQSNSRTINYEAERAGIEQFQRFDQRLQDVGGKLVRANAPYCEGAVPATGLQLQDMASYGRPDIARRALGLNGDFAVQTAARGSPAGENEAFAANREVTHIAGIDPNAWETEERRYWQRLTRAHDLIDARVAGGEPLEFTFEDGSSASLSAVEVCPSRFELLSGSDRAVADGKRVVIGLNFPAFAYEEELFAAVLAHELAHNLLAHTAWLDRNGRGRRNRRATEREADRLMPWLLANAGYDPRAAVRFFETYRPTSGSVLFIPGSHAKWRDRAALVADEAAQVEALIAAEGQADWSIHFTRKIDPQQGL